MVTTPASQRPTLRIKRHAHNRPLVSFERAEQLAASFLPELHCPIKTPARQRSTLRIKRHASDRALVPFERAKQLAASRLPELHRVVMTPAGQRPALRIKRHGTDHALVPFERAKQLHARRQLRPRLFVRPLPSLFLVCHTVKAFYAGLPGGNREWGQVLLGGSRRRPSRGLVFCDALSW